MVHKDLLKEWQTLFRNADKDNSGTLDKKELRNLLRQGSSKITDKQIKETFVFFDGPKGDKSITIDEFTKGMEHLFAFARQVEEWFRELDCDKSGYLERHEFCGFINKSGRSMDEAEVDEMMAHTDKSGDGKISLQEFLEAWVGKPVKALQYAK